ncbi:MAG: maleylpyruvate isomerase N-terminal domain-containing protein [Acidimicrobiia bacterium]
MDSIAIRDAARAGLTDVAQRLTTLVASLPEATTPILPGTWTVREAAVHLAIGADLYAELAAAMPVPVLATYTSVEEWNAESAALVADIPETDPHKLAVIMGDAAGRFLDVTGKRPADQPAVLFGLDFDVTRLVCVMLGEWALHGYDIAAAAGHPWPIDPGHAQLALYGYGSGLSLFVNAATAAGHTAAYGIEIRGGDGFTACFTDGAFAVEPAGSGPVDCVISADPVALLMVAMGRLSRWEAVALGLLSAGGNRPELALGFLDLFDIP